VNAYLKYGLDNMNMTGRQDIEDTHAVSASTHNEQIMHGSQTV